MGEEQRLARCRQKEGESAHNVVVASTKKRVASLPRVGRSPQLAAPVKLFVGVIDGASFSKHESRDVLHEGESRGVCQAPSRQGRLSPLPPLRPSKVEVQRTLLTIAVHHELGVTSGATCQRKHSTCRRAQSKRLAVTKGYFRLGVLPVKPVYYGAGS